MKTRAATPSLREIQRRFFGFVRRPLDPHDRLAPLPHRGRFSSGRLQSLLKPNDRLSSADRLELYARQYWFRLLDSLREDFPGVRSILGEPVFTRLLQRYLVRQPSHSYTLRHLGARLPDFLARDRSIASARRAAALAMARLEWAKIEAFDAGELPLLQLPPDSQMPRRVRLQPYLRLLALPYPVDIWQGHLRSPTEAPELASNTLNPVRPATRVRRSPIVSFKPQPCWLVVHRYQDQIYLKRLDRVAFSLLESIDRGQSLSVAFAAVTRRFPHTPAWWSQKLTDWFADWTSLHWLA
jgi:hypothetical protein